MVLSPRRPADERLRVGGSVVRIRPWADDPATAQIVPLSPVTPPGPAEVIRLLQRLAEAGYQRVRTSALGSRERAAYAAAGLRVLEELHLLRRDLSDEIPRTDVALHRPWRLVEALAVDRAAFPEGWQLDHDGLRDACEATPHHRVRVHGTPAIGYAVHGRAGLNGFVQRLAVHPSAQRAGIGSALVLDGLRWLRRRGAADALVNTQVGNAPALALYERLGFVVLDEHLEVLGGEVPCTLAQ
jgi:ribosomal protein S18 acetylase RimI-like enzyme